MQITEYITFEHPGVQCLEQRFIPSPKLYVFRMQRVFMQATTWSKMHRWVHTRGWPFFFCPGACPTADLNRPIRRHTMLHHTGCDFLPFSQDPSVPTLWCAFSAPSIPLSGDILLKMPFLTHLLVSHYIAAIFLSSFTDDIWIAGATDQEKWPPEGMWLLFDCHLTEKDGENDFSQNPEQLRASY